MASQHSAPWQPWNDSALLAHRSYHLLATHLEYNLLQNMSKLGLAHT